MVNQDHTLGAPHSNTATLEMPMLALPRQEDRFSRLFNTLTQGVLRC